MGTRRVAAVVMLAVIAAGCAAGEDDLGVDVPSPASAPTGAPADDPDTGTEQPTTAAAPLPTEVTAAPSVPGPSPSPRPTPTEVDAPTPQPPPAPEPIDWQACGGLECATVRVPLDYANPAGATLDLAVARAPARDLSRRIGSLFVNPGGPGGAGVEFLGSFAPQLPASIRDSFDIVSWDPRGVGETQGLDCEVDVAAGINKTLTPADGLVDDIERIAEDTAALGAGCARSAGDLLPFIDTVSVARDLDLLRQAVDDQQLSYLGFSYGSRLGAVYATLFPGNVRALALDGAFPPGLDSSELAGNGADLQATLERIDRVCDLELDCPLASDGLIETYTTLLRELDPEPNPTALGLSDQSLLLGATLLAIYVPSAWRTYTVALADATAGNIELLESLAEAWYTDNSGGFNDIYSGSNVAIMCADGAYPRTRTGVLRDARTALNSAPLLADIVVGAGCEDWPTAPVELPIPDAPDTAPILVIGGTYDPATPLRWAEQMAASFEDAALITYVGDGHTIVGRGNACVDGLTAMYLIDPERRIENTTCHSATGVLGVQLATAEQGLVVTSIVASGAAAQAGVIDNDVIVAVDGEPVTSDGDLITSAGQELTLTVARDGDQIDIAVVSGRRPWTLGP